MKNKIILLLFSFFIILPTVSFAGLFQSSRTSGLIESSITVNGSKRTYLLYVPTTATQQKSRRPLVIVMHGGGGNAENAVNMTGFNTLAAQENFIVAYPNGSGALGNILLTWNAVHCCGYAMQNNIDDVAFVSQLIDELAKTQGIDTKRVYVTGMSNGGLISHRIAREIPQKITAIAPVVAGLHGDEPLPRLAVPAMIINGALDQNVPPEGGNGTTKHSFKSAWDGVPLKPSEYQGTYWAKANGCNPQPRAGETQQGHPYWRYDCPKGQEVLRFIITDQGHAWPGGQKGTSRGDEPSQTFNATSAMWAFFKQHTRQ